MCKNLFPLLEPSDIECRVSQGGMKEGKAWASYLLYKTARVDQRLFDEVFGPMNWQCSYELLDGKMYCRISVWDFDKKCWVSKMNVGTESNTEAVKGEASDAMKRAGFAWGCGVELYSSPKIFVNLENGEYREKDGKIFPTLNLSVSDIQYNEARKVVSLTLKDRRGAVRYSFGQNAPATKAIAQERPIVYFSTDKSKSIAVGDNKWKKSVAAVAAGKTCDDGTPIAIWLQEYYNIPKEGMEKFFNDVTKAKDGKVD